MGAHADSNAVPVPRRSPDILPEDNARAVRQIWRLAGGGTDLYDREGYVETCLALGLSREEAAEFDLAEYFKSRELVAEAARNGEIVREEPTRTNLTAIREKS